MQQCETVKAHIDRVPATYWSLCQVLGKLSHPSSYLQSIQEIIQLQESGMGRGLQSPQMPYFKILILTNRQ